MYSGEKRSELEMSKTWLEAAPPRADELALRFAFPCLAEVLRAVRQGVEKSGAAGKRMLPGPPPLVM